MSLKNKLISLVLLCTLSPLLILMPIFYHRTWTSTMTEYTYSARESLNKSAELINRELLNLAQKGQYVSSNEKLFEKVRRNFGDNLLEKVIFYNDVNLFLERILLLDGAWTDVFAVYITNPSLYENKYVKFLDSSHNAAYIRESVLSQKGAEGVWKPDLSLDDKSKLYLGYYRKLISGTNLLSGTQDVAVLEAKVYISDIEYLMRNVSLPTNSLYILRSASGKDYHLGNEGRLTLYESDNPIWAANSQVLHASLINGYQLIVAIPNAEISIQSMRSYAIMLSVMILTVCCVLFTSTFTLKRVTKSLNDFILAIKHEDVGLLMDTLPEDDTNEISMIKKRFTKLVTTIQTLNDEKLKAFKHTKQMEIDLLQAKFNPHLLYNSLSVIKWLAQRNRDARMVDLVNSLTRYYRKILNNGNTILEVREELSLVRELVNIMSINHASEYKLETRVDQNLMTHRTIKMIFQPLVENAIIHGLNGKDGEKKIIITGEFREDFIQFVIEDNGHGLSHEKLDSVLADFRRENTTEKDHDTQTGFGSSDSYGLSNLFGRIKSYYGENATFSIESEEGCFTRAILRFPACQCEYATEQNRME